MATVTFAISDEVKSEMKELSWINWSELVREELLKKEKKQELLNKLLRVSKKEDRLALKLGDKIKGSMWKRYKAKGW